MTNPDDAGAGDQRPTRTDLEHALISWQLRLGLAQWDIDLQVHDAEPGGDPLDEHTWMRTARHASYQRAVIRVASHLLHDGPSTPGAWTDAPTTPARVEAILAHELLHLWTAPLADVIDAIEDQITPAAFEVLEAARDSAEERLVDTLARALVIAWPNPPASPG